jgi:GTP-binding protein
MIECITEDPETQYKTLVNELKSFNETMLKKPQIIAITKMDLADDTLRKSIKKIKFPKKYPLLHISAVSGEHLKELIDEIWKKLKRK